MTTYLSDGLARIVAMQKEIITTSDAKPFFFYAQESFPYWTNRVGNVSVELQSQDFYIYTHHIVMRLVIGHKTEGYTGDLEQTLQTTYIPQTLEYFAGRIRLQSASYPGIMTDIDPRGAIMLNCTGLATFQDGGIGVEQIGSEFTLEMPIQRYIEQVY